MPTTFQVIKYAKKRFGDITFSTVATKVIEVSGVQLVALSIYEGK